MNTLLTFDPIILVEILIPLGVCVVLPCILVYILACAHRNDVNRKTELALKAIEKGVQIDPSLYASHKKKGLSVKAKVFICLIIGVILTGVGLAMTILSFLPLMEGFELTMFSNFPTINAKMILIEGMTTLFAGLACLVIYFIARKHFAAEIKAEEEKIFKTE